MIKVENLESLDRSLTYLGNRIRMAWDGQKPIEVLFREWKDPHTRSQQALYRIWCREIGAAINRHEDDVHDLLRYRFLGTITLEIDGDEIIRLPSTNSLGKQDMSEYMGKVEAQATEWGIMLSMPADNEYVKYREAAQ